MSKYRINVRFDTDDPKQAEAVKFLQSVLPVCDSEECCKNYMVLTPILAVG